MKRKATILSVRNLKKSFKIHLLGELTVNTIENFSFDVDEGDFAVLVGPSGIGKSTVLNCIFRTYLVTGGNIIYSSRDGSQLDLASCDERTIMRLRNTEMAYVTQFLHCQPRMAAELVVAAPRVAQGLSLEQALQEARELMERMALPRELWRAFPATFSGGERQRVNLARALISKPRLLLMDEPIASLDPKSIATVVDILKEMRQKGTTFLSVFHELGPIKSLVTKVIPLGSRSLQDLEANQRKRNSGSPEVTFGR
jgi:alpha-D-ribose 1-methylphosphonate 5-triphosphate synthase subunit PhnL